MEAYENLDFHDGSFDGLRINGASVSVFVRSRAKQSFVIALTGVTALSAQNIRAGNIIFDLQLRRGPEITAEDIRRLHEIQRGVAGEMQVAKLLEEASAPDVQLFEITSSYGGDLIALMKDISVEPSQPSK
jgi:hypothetical protein